MTTHEALWLTFGFGGQALFFSRFFVQWIASERRKQSVIPNAFWFLSLGGGTLLLTYAIYRQDPVFVLGQSCGVLIYCRNLWLIYDYRHPPQRPAYLEPASVAAFGEEGEAGAGRSGDG